MDTAFAAANRPCCEFISAIIAPEFLEAEASFPSDSPRFLAAVPNCSEFILTTPLTSAEALCACCLERFTNSFWISTGFKELRTSQYKTKENGSIYLLHKEFSLGERTVNGHTQLLLLVLF